MAAVASGRLLESFRGPEVEQAAESGSGFTAVNGSVNEGRSPVASCNTIAAVEPHREPVEEPRNRDMHTNGLGRKESPTTPNPPINRAPSRQEASGESRHNSTHSGASSSQQTHTTNTSPQSRKRSFAEYQDDPKNSAYHIHGFPKDPDRHRGYHEGEDRKEEARGQHIQQRSDNGRTSPKEPPYQQVTGNVYRAHQSPPDMQPQTMEPREHEHRPEYERPPDYRRQSMYDRQHTRPEYETPPDVSSQPNRPYYNPHADEASFAAALQRETRDYESAAPETFASPDDFPDDDDEQGGQGFGDYSGNRGSQSGVERDMKRRKRVFSNRTKTGCMTCRRRKKKCDEQHPECNNCLRGGFVCEGYSMRNTWQKPPNVKPPMPIQSKNGYTDVMSRQAQSQQRYGQDIHHEYGHGQPRQPHGMPSDGDRIKPIMVDDERYPPPPSGPESHNAHLRPKWETPPRQPPTNSQYNSRYQSEPDHRPASSAYENPHAQQTPEPQTLHVPPNTQRSNSSQYIPHTTSSHPPHNAPAVAQAALHQHATLAPRPPPPPQQAPLPRRPSPPPRVEMTERQKMLKGDYYFPYSPALIEDREKCLANLWRFNNATSPASGISIEERPRLFKAILHNRPAPEPPGGDVGSSNMPPPSGSVGDNVIVEAPFYCDYGYNIIIGDDVLIGPDCRISDSCTVTIGARCIFSPNVKLVCATYPIDPRKRMGSRGQALARNITIEEDCWIGSDVTITAGVRIGKSSTIGAGSLVHQNVPRFTVVAGNPAKVQRGIYNDESGL